MTLRTNLSFVDDVSAEVRKSDDLVGDHQVADSIAVCYPVGRHISFVAVSFISDRFIEITFKVFCCEKKILCEP